MEGECSGEIENGGKSDLREEDNLLLYLNWIKEKALKCSDDLMQQYSVPELKEETQQLWTDTRPQISKEMEIELKELLEESKTAESIAKLIALRHKYEGKESPAWGYSTDPSQLIQDMENIAAKSLEPKYNELLQEGVEFSSQLYSEYKTLKEQMAELDREISDTYAENTTKIESLANEINPSEL